MESRHYRICFLGNNLSAFSYGIILGGICKYNIPIFNSTRLMQFPCYFCIFDKGLYLFANLNAFIVGY